MQWAIYKNRRFIGIIETNWSYASQYWKTRGDGIQLIAGYGFKWNGYQYIWQTRKENDM